MTETSPLATGSIRGQGAKIRFIHTSDWQLGMTRAFLSTESQSRYADDQISAIRTLADLANTRSCAFVVVAGDVFDSPQPTERTRLRTIDALGAFRIPVYLLPGNHDPDSPASLWSTSDLLTRLPDNVTLIRNSKPINVPGVPVEIVGAPWISRRPDTDLVAAALSALDPSPPSIQRILIGHGTTDSLSPDPSDRAVISLAAIQDALTRGLIHYVALGDRHSQTQIGSTNRLWYSGAPVATSYSETDPNHALIVEIDDDRVTVDSVDIGSWSFQIHTFHVNSAQDVASVGTALAALGNKDRTVLKLGFTGTVSLEVYSQLEEILMANEHLFAALERSQRRSDLVVVPNTNDFSDLETSGFLYSATQELMEQATSDSPEANESLDALLLLRRLIARLS
ncbi:MAG: metallophosphoesterase family protein [Ferrimicrobium sp.]